MDYFFLGGEADTGREGGGGGGVVVVVVCEREN